MVDFILAGLSAGIVVFIALFLIVFLALGTVTALVHLIALAYRGLFAAKPSACQLPAA